VRRRRKPPIFAFFRILRGGKDAKKGGKYAKKGGKLAPESGFFNGLCRVQAKKAVAGQSSARAFPGKRSAFVSFAAGILPALSST